MKYSIKFTTYTKQQSAESIISAALGFDKALSHGTVVDLFSEGLRHKQGVFTSKKAAKIVAENINKRGAFGGFPVRVFAEVVAA